MGNTDQSRRSPPAATETAAAATPAVAPDTLERRRPGRARFVNPWLIPLLRTESVGEASGGAASDAGGPALPDTPGLPPRAMRGVAIGVMVAIPLWIAIGLFVAWIVRRH